MSRLWCYRTLSRVFPILPPSACCATCPSGWPSRSLTRFLTFTSLQSQYESYFTLVFMSLLVYFVVQNFFQASKYIPDICVIRAVQKIVWASGCGMVHLVFSSNEEISQIYQKVCSWFISAVQQCLFLV